MESILKISNLTKKFGNLACLDDISIDIGKNGIVGLLGPNGSGKTTLIKIIAGLIGGYEGNISINGMKVDESKKIVSYLPDIEVMPSWWNIDHAVNFFNDFFNDFDKTKALSIINDFKIPINAKFKTLSKGTREKVQLSLYLSRKAKLYIFDEPIAGVDPIARDVIFKLILDNYNKDSLVLIATHLVSNIENILDSVIFIKTGKIIVYDSMENLSIRFDSKRLEEIFKELL